MAKSDINNDSGISVRSLGRDWRNPSAYEYKSVIQNSDGTARTETILVDLGRYELPTKIGNGKYNTITPDITDILEKDHPAALFLTHAHSDHIDGVYEYVLRAIEAEEKGETYPLLPPVVTASTTRNMLEDGFKQHGISPEKLSKYLTFIDIKAHDKVVINDGTVSVVAPDASVPENALSVTVGAAPHSLPDSLFFTLDNGHAKVFHSGDFRPDETSTISQVVGKSYPGKMESYKADSLPENVDLAVVDFHNSVDANGNALKEYSPTEAEIGNGYKALLNAENPAVEVAIVMQGNHVERLFTGIKAGLDAGRPVIIDGGTEMDKHVLAVLHALEMQGDDGIEVMLNDLFAPFQKDPEHPLPIIYRAANAVAAENEQEKADALLAGKTAPLLLTTGLYTHTEEGATLYAALSGQYKGKFPLAKNAKIVLTDPYDALAKDEFRPLRDIQNKTPAGKSLTAEAYNFNEITVNKLPAFLASIVPDADKDNVKTACLSSLSKNTQAKLRKALSRVPDVRNMDILSAKDNPYKIFGPGHACGNDIYDMCTKLDGWVYGVHSNNKKAMIEIAQSNVKLSKTATDMAFRKKLVDYFSELSDVKAGMEIFTSKGAAPQIVSYSENKILLSDRNYDINGKVTNTTVVKEGVKFNSFEKAQTETKRPALTAFEIAMTKKRGLSK